VSENLEKQCQEIQKVKERNKDADKRGKQLDFGPAVIRELESGKIYST
jgi:hypothetical protein